MTTKSELVARARSIEAEIQQIFADAEHWNNEHPDEQIDVDGDGRLAAALRVAEGIGRAK